MLQPTLGTIGSSSSPYTATFLEESIPQLLNTCSVCALQMARLAQFDATAATTPIPSDLCFDCGQSGKVCCNEYQVSQLLDYQGWLQDTCFRELAPWSIYPVCMLILYFIGLRIGFFVPRCRSLRQSRGSCGDAGHEQGQSPVWLRVPPQTR